MSFLDHHLRCGDSLFGETVGRVLNRLEVGGHAAFIGDEIQKAVGSASAMNTIESLTDAEIAEAHRSADMFNGILKMTDPLNTFLKTLHAIDWLDLKKEKREDGSQATETDLGVVRAWLDGTYGDPVAIATGKAKVPKKAERFQNILTAAQTLVSEENFMNWEVAFPGVWRDWDTERTGGFDAVIGNPPWDRIKLQEVEWFTLRNPKVAMAQRAADRKEMIKALADADDPLFGDYAKAKERAEASARMARTVGDYPLLSGGDINLYSLFVERAMSLLNDGGIMGLLTPSGIASDKTASKFFKSIATTGRLKALYDFENRRTRYGLPPFFPDVDSRFKFIALITSRTRTFEETNCAFFLQGTNEITDPDRCFPLTAGDFARVNPNTGTAPILRSRRDAELTKAVYARVPVLVDRSNSPTKTVWPVKYDTMFHMANDSAKFRTISELEETEGAWHVGGNIWESSNGQWLPLYEGKMCQAFDHRASDIRINNENQFRPGQPENISTVEKADPSRVATPRYWVLKGKDWPKGPLGWSLAFKDITAATNMRTMIATIIPAAGAGHTFPRIVGTENCLSETELMPVVLANLNSIPFDYLGRQKVPTTHFTWFVMEQIPVIPLDELMTGTFGLKTAAEIIKPAVLELTYTAHDMAPFARDMGHVDEDGKVLPPFPWDEARRLRLRAKLDAVFFHFYGIFDAHNREQSRDDISYIYSTFPIVERQEIKGHGRYLSRDLALAYCNTLAAGHPDAEPEV